MSVRYRSCCFEYEFRRRKISEAVVFLSFIVAMSRSRSSQCPPDQWVVDVLSHNDSVRAIRLFTGKEKIADLFHEVLDAEPKQGRIEGCRPKLKVYQQEEIVLLVTPGQKIAVDTASLFNVHPIYCVAFSATKQGSLTGSFTVCELLSQIRRPVGFPFFGIFYTHTGFLSTHTGFWNK